MAEAMSEGHQTKRILVVSQHFWPESFRSSDIVEGFVEAGVEVDVLCGLPNYPRGEWFEGYRYTGPRRQQYKGAEVFRAGEIRRKNNNSLRIFLNYVSFPLAALFNLPRLWGRRYDAVFCYETSPVLMMLPAILRARRRSAPLTTYVLDLWPDNLYSVLPIKARPLRALAQGVSNWHYRRSHRLIALSEGMADTLRSVTRGKRPVTVIPQYCEDFYAADIDDAALRARYAGPFNLLFAGNISPAQDLENLVSAVELLQRQGVAPTALRCLIVGEGMSREALEADIGRRGLAAYFAFPGPCAPTDIPRWTGVANALYAGLAKSANLGLTVPAKVSSYLAAAKPILAAAEGEMARALRESGAALTSGAGDAGALAENICALMAMDEQQRACLGRAGRAYYREHYAREKLLRQLLATILEDEA